MEHILNDFTAATILPQRDAYGHKGSFGRAFAYIGSKKFHGAAHLALEAILRGGCGYTELAGDRELVSSLLYKFPEVIYTALPPTEELSENEAEIICQKSSVASATLIGSGSDSSEKLCDLTVKLLSIDTMHPIILDADALNSIARYGKALDVIKAAKRPVIITPHEMEFSRITGLSVNEIQSSRPGIAERIAKDVGCIIILKGHNTVITDGNKTYVNATGNSALAKGGSGDALAGLLTSLVASARTSLLDLSALACYIHGEAGDSLAEVYSDFGVTPSDLPREMAKTIKRLSDIKKDFPF